MKLSVLISNLNQVVNPNYVKNLHKNFLLTEENNDGGVIKAHHLKIQGNVKNFAYSLDSRCELRGSNLNPFDVFKQSTANICSKNDLTILCPDDENSILKVFILEMKSFNATGAAHQIRSGKNFLDYLIATHNLNFSHLPYTLEVYGILAKKQKVIPKVTTSTKNRKFIFNCKEYKGYKIPTLEWNVDELLPLTHIISNMVIKEY